MEAPQSHLNAIVREKKKTSKTERNKREGKATKDSDTAREKKKMNIIYVQIVTMTTTSNSMMVIGILKSYPICTIYTHSGW